MERLHRAVLMDRTGFFRNAKTCPLANCETIREQSEQVRIAGCSGECGNWTKVNLAQLYALFISTLQDIGLAGNRNSLMGFCGWEFWAFFSGVEFSRMKCRARGSALSSCFTGGNWGFSIFLYLKYHTITHPKVCNAYIEKCSFTVLLVLIFWRLKSVNYLWVIMYLLVHHRNNIKI